MDCFFGVFFEPEKPVEIMGQFMVSITFHSIPIKSHSNPY